MRSQQTLAVLGLILSVLAWPAFGIFFGYAMGDVFAQDPEERARLIAQQQLISVAAGSAYLISVPLAAWIAGRTYVAHRTLSLLTSISISGLAGFLIVIMFLE